MRLPLHIVITTHSQFGREQNVLLFYSLFIIEFTYCMYIIVNKATFIVAETIMVIIKNRIKLINTTSLSDNQSYLSAVATHNLPPNTLSMIFENVPKNFKHKP